jgi:hypothetical protein
MSMNQLLGTFASAIDAEIALLEKESREQAYELLSGEREEKSTGTLYVFVLGDTLRLPEEAAGVLKVNGRDVNAMVVSQEGNRIWLLLESLEPLPEYIPSARLVVNETDLLKRLKEKIEVLRSSSELGLAPKVFGFAPATADSAALEFDFGERLDEQSKGVLQQCIGSEITFVWGPPGTGKTFTIAALVASLTEAKDTVLVTSHTHAAVEQALWALVEHPSADRQAGFLYNSPLMEEGRILKVGELKSDKVPRSVHLQSYLEDKAKEREDTIQILQEERERISRQLDELKAIQASWLELKQAEIAYQSLRERHENAVAMRNVNTAEVANAKADVDRFEAEHLRVQRSFFIGRRRRVQKSLEALTYAKQALVSAEAKAGHAEANVIKTERVSAENHARLLQLQQVTADLKPRAEVEEEITADEKREATLASEIEAIQVSAKDDAKQVIQNALAIFATLTKLYIDQDLLADIRWDTVIIDEVSMAMLPLVAYAASRARKRVVLVGDMYQLPPVVNSQRGTAGEILASDIFEFRGITKMVDSGSHQPDLAKLTTQRRMHPDIAAGAKVLIDRYSHLVDSSDVKTRQRPNFLSAIDTDVALVFVDISDLNPWSGKMPGSLSRFNFISGQVAVEVSSLFAAKLGQPEEKMPPPIGIITPYAAQRRYLNKLIQMFRLERWVGAGTVHTFQGNECDLVIFDSVLGEPHWTARFTNPNSWIEVRRDLNVALTRARHQFVFIGDRHWLDKHAKTGTGYGNLWSFLKGRAVELSASHILGEGFEERVAETVVGVKCWDIKGTDKAVFLTEADFYEHFVADLLKAKRRVVLYTPFIGKTRWPFVAPYIAMLRDRNVEVFLLHKPLTDPEWRRYDMDFGRKVFDSLTHLGVRLIHMSGVHAKTIVVDSEIVYDGSLNWASQTSSREHMWRFESPDMAKLVEKMLQLDPITNAFNQVNLGDRCPNCGGPLILINQAKQQPRDHYPLRLGCERWNEDKRTCTGYLRPVDGRAPFLKPPRCSRGTVMHIHYTKEGHPWDWRCGHKGCRTIRWVRGDCLGDFSREVQGQKNRDQTKAKEPKIKRLKFEPELPKDLLIQVEKLSQQGLSLREIAGRFGVSIEVLQESIDSVRQQIDKLMEEIFKDEDHPNDRKA